MTIKKDEVKVTERNKFTAQFKEQALERAGRDGFPTVAKDLRLAESMLYSWRAKRKQIGKPFDTSGLYR
mgnify:CR=1 FL=1